MPETRDRLWIAEFTGPHIEGTAYLALPNKQDGFEIPYIRQNADEAQAASRYKRERDLLLAAAKQAIAAEDSADPWPRGRAHRALRKAIAECGETER